MNPLSLLLSAANESESGRNMAGTPEACRAAFVVVEAARKLYLSGRWTAGLPAPLEARMWEDLRDALGLEPGTATDAGIGSAQPHNCPKCEDAMECDCEPPLPMFGGEVVIGPLAPSGMAPLKALLGRPGVEL